jgi:transcriptional regulator with XRE-family HTH domain
MTLAEIGKQLREARKKKGWSQDRVAMTLNYHQRDISEMETGARNMYLMRVHEYASLVGVTIEIGKRAAKTRAVLAETKGGGDE